MNGVLDRDAPLPSGPHDTTGFNWRIGSGSGIGYFREPFIGRIDEVGVHDRALTADEIAELAATPPDRPCFASCLTCDGEIARIVEAEQYSPTVYEFEIDYTTSEGPVLIKDTIPAEWTASLLDDDEGRATLVALGRRGRGANRIEWEPAISGALELSSHVIRVRAETRMRPNGRYAPTSCGKLVLNAGAQVFELDPATGEPLEPPVLETEELAFGAVEDVNDDGFLLHDGTGDEDGDSAVAIAGAEDFETGALGSE